MGEQSDGLKFGTSGLRGRVVDMTDREVYLCTAGFLAYLEDQDEGIAGDSVAIAEDRRAVCSVTGMESSPRIARAVAQAIVDANGAVVHCGLVPTPALALYATSRGIPAVMVTGSHIPEDRNGVKFYRRGGEVLKEDEAGIAAQISRLRGQDHGDLFDAEGAFQRPPDAAPAIDEAARLYVDRYLNLAARNLPLAGKKIVSYEHTAVGRELTARVLRGLGAEVIAVGRATTFVAVDTEDVSVDDEERYRDFIDEHGADALVSTDGDGDRPLIVDELGRFHRGDVVGAMTARWLGATVGVVPVSTSDAVDRFFDDGSITLCKTRIGSPFVIAAMAELAHAGGTIVGWEANGGFLTQSPLQVAGTSLAALPTRDALLPIVAVLCGAAEAGVPLSEYFAQLPQRATRAALLDGVVQEASARLVAALGLPAGAPLEVVIQDDRVTDPSGLAVSDEVAQATCAVARKMASYLRGDAGFGLVVRINYVDGIRMTLDNDEIVHLRPSGNAPQLRMYAVADTQVRADAMAAMAIESPDGILRRLIRDFSTIS